MTADEGQEVGEWFQKNTCWLVTDLLEGDNPFVSPINYFGNAIIPGALKYKKLMNVFTDNVYMHALTNICLIIHKACEENRIPERVAEKLIGVYDVLRNANMMITIPLYISSLAWSFVGRRKNGCDFGEGLPCFMYVPLPFPAYNYTSCFFSDPSHKGIFATVAVLNPHRTKFLNSQVLQHCAPGARYVFGNDSDPHIDPMPLW